jgi:CRP-like cAMP-binding protein
LGEFFGEMSLLSGRPRTETAIAGAACILVETPRRTMLKLMNSNEDVRKGIDWIFVVRELQRQFAPHATLAELRSIAANLKIQKYKAGDVVFTEGQIGDCLYVVRSGGITLTRKRDGQDALVAQIPSGELVGELALMGDPQRRETAKAAVASELIEVKRQAFVELTERGDARVLARLQEGASRRVTDIARMMVQPEAGSTDEFHDGGRFGRGDGCAHHR